jgi:hypothetical protein
MRFAKTVFYLAGAYGLLNLLPQYFLEEKLGSDFPPPINHPEFFYGFLGVAAAWQVLFLMIARDPARLRPAMLPGVLEKLSFGIATLALYASGRLPGIVLAFGVMDLVFAALFVAAYRAAAP